MIVKEKDLGNKLYTQVTRYNHSQIGVKVYEKGIRVAINKSFIVLSFEQANDLQKQIESIANALKVAEEI